MRYFLIFIFSLLTACGSALPTVKPFKMDIQQGNVVTSKMLLQLKPGMTKSQVKFIMGSPLIVDSFHKNRWDYFYQMRKAGKVVEQRRVILDFDKELLTKVRGDVVPEGTAGAATGNESAVAKTITVEPKPKEEKSWTEKLKFWKKEEPAKETTKQTATPEKIDAPEANIGAPAGDAPSIEASTPDTPSVLAVPIGGVLTPDSPAVEAPTDAAKVEAPVISAPVPEEPVIIAPVVEAPPVEIAKPVEMAKPIEWPKETQKAVPMPAAKAGERLIFRMDKNLDLKNIEAPAEAAPAVEMPKIENNAAPTAAKPKKIEAPLPPEEAPGYFERMLEKIGF